jgi:hypothetical protein
MLTKRRVLSIAVATLASSMAMVMGTGIAHANPGIEVGVPAYVFPNDTMANNLEVASPSAGIVVLNHGNGDEAFDSNWQDQADAIRANGTKVLGYVYANNGNRAAADVKASIDRYIDPPDTHELHVDGIFVDLGGRDCGTNNVTRDYFKSLRTYIQEEIYAQDPNLEEIVVNNPGTAVADCYLDGANRTADIFVTFEGTESTYANSWLGGNVFNSNGYRLGTEYNNFSFWHLVYGANMTNMNSIIDTAFDRHAGHVYVTNDTTPNPWDSTPSNGFSAQTTYAATVG